MSGLFVRLVDQKRAPCRFYVNGEPCTARQGDTVMTALLTRNAHLRLTEFTGSPRAGFCLMGACQDCLVTQESGERIRACATLLQADMRFVIPEQVP
ncbi:ferredoxin [Advenella kashmirensis W13003]|uniref:Ferredoxin n=1 Tax=Advenella kashmirensis W13003 TaxID=1424334 RepID=V8QXJ9_9BURK|nr:(2Fe-2S)-binding protein [Advenella kashmirensis]ETF04382.1 ferredoxin [Advenella kashmirensis W13003]